MPHDRVFRSHKNKPWDLMAVIEENYNGILEHKEPIDDPLI